jgi:hypothetical protein
MNPAHPRGIEDHFDQHSAGGDPSDGWIDFNHDGVASV